MAMGCAIHISGHSYSEQRGKHNLIDLEDFMEKNYMLNMTAEKFGYLTGRSLTTFKRILKRYSALLSKNGRPRKDWSSPIISYLKGNKAFCCLF